ncbi:histamine H1 receptor [Hemicordylus capensis]|uniref:histamine H1 receptor n=1 Tax=Hemicordylus capensis TaxID=884348 RepID=UPI0023036253|nr:histamine H1 receptor [Hemicordylus capensis]
MCWINTTNNSTEIYPVPLGLFLGSIALITVVMNILVLYAVKTEKKLHTVSNLYIVSLSCADLIVGAAVMPLNIVYLLKGDWILDRKACLFWLSMDYVASTASIFSLFILCIDRYRSVQQPLKYLKYRTKTKASIMISGAWLLSFMWIIPILGWRKFDNSAIPKSGEKVCETDFCNNLVFKVLTAMVNFYVPSLLMLWFYAKIYKAVRKHHQHRELIDWSFRSVSEKKGNNADLQEMQKVCSQRKSRDVQYVCNENEKRMEVKLSPSSCVKIPKVFHRRGDREVVKLSCFPPAIVQNGTEVGNKERKYGYFNQDIRNTEKPCPKDYELSKTSEGNSFVERPSCRNDCDPSLEQNSDPQGCFPQDRTDTTSLRYLKKTWGRMRTHSIYHSQGLHINRNRKAAKQLGCIMAAFMLCWTPYFVLFLVMAFCESCYNRPFYMFTIWLGYVNSALNPFIYPFCNENFKKTFKKILHIKT